ncbi:MAG: FCD domain-containing protein [Pseudomonadota bacterium]|nr:FCD domain-containing protein [Pseudomonadota bacterium]
MTRTQQITEALECHITDTGLRVGDKLPSERELSRVLGCSRETLRRALAEMEMRGELWRHVGQGTFLGARPSGHPVRDAILVQGATPLQLMQARMTIEPSVAADAAVLASPAQIAWLNHLIARGRAAKTRSECEQLDAAFHRGLAEVTGNPILLGLLDYLTGVRRHAAWQREWEQTYRRLGVSTFTTFHCEQHAKVVACIAQGQGDEAATAMRQHLETIFEAMKGAGPVS